MRCCLCARTHALRHVHVGNVVHSDTLRSCAADFVAASEALLVLPTLPSDAVKGPTVAQRI
jgi:hypothetical protein